MVAVGACSSSPPAAAPPPPVAKPAVAPRRSAADEAALAKAKDLRLGKARDFVAAARIYADLCRAGCGDQEACREYLHLAAFSRGAVLARADLDIAVRLCDRGDALACEFASFTGMREKAYDPAAVTAACDRGDRQACALESTFDFEGTRLGIPCEGTCPPDPPTLGRRATLHACLHGEGRACGSLLASRMALCRAETPDACVDAAAREYEAAKLGSAKPLRDAWAKTRALCTDGDVDACAQVPGHEVPRATLCAAGDYPSCNSSDDPALRKRGCDAGHRELCEPPGETASGAMRLLGMRDACAKGDKAVCAAVARDTAVTACT